MVQADQLLLRSRPVQVSVLQCTVYSVQWTVDIVSSAYSWPGVGKPLDQYGPPGKPAADDNDDDDDDDDVDLFGSDDEDAVSLMRMEF